MKNHAYYVLASRCLRIRDAPYRSIGAVLFLVAFVTSFKYGCGGGGGGIEKGIKTSPKLIPPEKIVQTKIWDEIKLDFQKVTESMTKDQCIALLGTPQWDERDIMTYLERPGGFGTMEYFKIILKQEKVQSTEKGTIIVDPW